MANKFQYKKSLGQNFIYDLVFLRSLVKDLDIRPHNYIIEIGTGAGTLTKVLAESGASIKTIEIDGRLEPALTKEFAATPNVTLAIGDVMKMDFATEPEFRLVANIPYYITTPIIMKFLALPNCMDINILTAGDVAKRIVARSGAEYGALSVTCQCFGDCFITKSVGKEMFTPRPKIDSAFVRIIKNNNQNIDRDLFAKLLKGVFASRRKTMLNALSNSFDLPKTEAAEILQAAGIDGGVRPENVSPTKFTELCQILTKFGK
jgi:16S rRNA (adenine1518-N6/adenine1519-N6)-dimethyltransferase